MDACGPDTVVLIKRDVAGQDRYGNDVQVDSEITVPYCGFQPMWGQETVGALDQVTDRYQVFVPGLALTDLEIDPHAVDAIRHHGLLYEVNGEPARHYLGDEIDHVRIFCRRVTG